MSETVDFKRGDRVRVQIDEEASEQDVITVFDADVLLVNNGGKTIRLRVDWGLANTITLESTDAEFEVISDG